MKETDRPTPKLFQLTAVAVTGAVPLVSAPGLVSPFSTPKLVVLGVWVVVGTVALVPGGLTSLRFDSMIQKLALGWLALVSLSALWGQTVSLRALLIALLPAASFLLLTWLRPCPGSLAVAMVISGSVVAVVGSAQHLGLDPFRLFAWEAPPGGAARMRVYATLGNPDFVAAFLASVLPMAWVLNGSRLGGRIFSGLAALLMALGIIATGSRAPIVGAVTFVLCAVWLFRSFSVRARVLVLVFIAVLAAFLAIFSAGRPIPEVFRGRLFIWRVTLAHASARTLILGDGPGAFAIRYPGWETEWLGSAQRGRDGLRFLGYQEHAHNDWLEVLVEQGIVGLVLLLLVLLSAFRIFTAHPSSRLAAAAVAGIAIFVGLALVDFPLHRPAESHIFWTLLAVVYLSSESVSERDRVTSGVVVESVSTDREGVS